MLPTISCHEEGGRSKKIEAFPYQGHFVFSLRRRAPTVRHRQPDLIVAWLLDDAPRDRGGCGAICSRRSERKRDGMNPRTTWKHYPRRFALPNLLLLVALLSSLLVAGAATPAAAATTPTDNFNRANGALGPNWTTMTDGALAISSQAVVGTTAAVYSGSIRTGEAYSANQSSQFQITAPQLSIGQLIGAGVAANGGRNLYLGAYTRTLLGSSLRCTSASTATGPSSAPSRAVFSRPGPRSSCQPAASTSPSRRTVSRASR